MAVLQGEFLYSKHNIASIPCQAKWPVYRGGRTSESRNSESTVCILLCKYRIAGNFFGDKIFVVQQY